MGLVSEFRFRARYLAGSLLCVSVVGYFAYHAVNGERGLYAWRELTKRVEAARLVSAETSARRKALEHRNSLLNPGSLDPDMLEERARLMLNFGYSDDILILEAKPRRDPGSVK